MAVNYQIIDSYKTTVVLAGTTVNDAQYIVTQTIPTGITFGYAMDHALWLLGGPYTILEQMSAILENCVTNNHVVAGNDVQDLDKNGLLTDYCDLIVELDQTAANLPPLDGTVSLPVKTLELFASLPPDSTPPTKSPATLCDEEYARLKTLAAG